MGQDEVNVVDGDNSVLDGTGSTLDRSKLHVLLCDRDQESCLHVMKLLQQCLYRVTCVKSAGQVIGVLDSCGYEVDLILTEVELPKEKGLKLLKHIARLEQLHRIPIVMMSAIDEMALVVKCLRLGAVDYLLKPLRMNELLNLWTHTWRRRRMLGLSEKHILNDKLRIPFDMLFSDTSESNNTNGTSLFSDDTDQPKRMVTVPEDSDLNLTSCGVESEASPQLELSLRISFDVAAEVSSKSGLVASFPHKTQLKIGQSSAFISYEKGATASGDRIVKAQCVSQTVIENTNKLPMAQTTAVIANIPTHQTYIPNQPGNSELPQPELQSTVPSYPSLNENVNKPGTSKQPIVVHSDHTTGDETQASTQHIHPANEGMMRFSSNPAVRSHFPACDIAAQSLQSSKMLQSPFQVYAGVRWDNGASIVPGIPFVPSQALPIAAPFSYYSYGTHISAPQMGSLPGWSPFVPPVVMEHKPGRSERREAALDKFRRKRKDRCFDKKIRYVSRKKLAEQRPRIRGQFVKSSGGKDSNGAFDEYEDEDDDDQGFDDFSVDSSPESVAEDS